jgi:hypothetical protein
MPDPVVHKSCAFDVPADAAPSDLAVFADTALKAIREEALEALYDFRGRAVAFELTVRPCSDE